MENAQDQPLGRVIDRMKELRDQRRELTRQADALKAEFDELKDIVINRCQADETDGARGKTASAVITQQTVARATDWDVYIDWVKENDAWYLFERKIKASAYSELIAMGEQPPGTEPLTVYNVSLTSL
jgi:uncharacterized protein YjiS (DUF1127 family)